VNDSAVVQDTVENGGSNCNIGKNLVPLGKDFVEGKDGGGFLIPSGNELGEQIGAPDIHGEITNLVNDEHPVFGQDLELVGQTILKVSFLQLLNHLVAVDIVGGEAVLCIKAEGGGQVGLTHPGRSEKHHILTEY